MKYLNGHSSKSCHSEKLRTKELVNPHTGEEYVAYYPKGYDVLGYFDSGSQVNVSTIVHRASGKTYLLKNEIVRNVNSHFAIRNEIIASYLIESAFPRNDGPSIPRLIEAAHFGDFKHQNYLIEEKKEGSQLSSKIVQDMSHKAKKYVAKELAYALVKLHFLIPDKLLLRSDFMVDRNRLSFNPMQGYRYKAVLDRLCQLPKHGFVHFDLQCPNILFDGRTLSIIDFGRAGITNRCDDFAQLWYNYPPEFVKSVATYYIQQCCLMGIASDEDCYICKRFCRKFRAEHGALAFKRGRIDGWYNEGGGRGA